MAKLEDDSTSWDTTHTSLDQKEVPSHENNMESTPPPPHHLPWLVLDSRHPFYILNQCFLSGRAVPKSFESNSDAANYTRSCVSIVTLPSKLPIKSGGNYNFLRVVASSAPTGPQRCLVAAIVPVRNNSSNEARRELALCRPTHESWTMIKFEEVNHEFLFCDIEVIDRKLYAATKNLFMVFNIKDIDGCHLSYKLVETVKLENDKPVNWFYDYWGLDKDRNVQIFEDGPYLVKDVTSKELFVIFRYVSLSRSLPIIYCTEGFRVLKLENCIASSSLVEVSDLGDRRLFLSKFSNQLISSGNGVKGSDEMTTPEGNCICFAFNWPRVMLPGGDFGVFSLTNKRVMPLRFPEDQCPAELFFGSTVWFNPFADSKSK
ncbi:hypothetical protein ACLB2K_061984 [Fragaria x ananassa]